MSPFSSVLVANRGEIAVRVIRAARASGLRSVAVYSDADRDARHVHEADTAVRIGPASAIESYLSIEAILAAASKTGAEAVHPGYGFLSERAAFARAVEEAGLVFIGPSGDVMEQMGRKDHAREIAERAGVPVTPRYDLAPDGTCEIPGEAYPVLVKAAAGGGGKGMRIVHSADELPDAVGAARREAASAFGDGTLLVEKYVEAGRHVEVQVMGDHRGNVVHFFERDCSVQRRHQKVLEEAPAPTISDAVRATLTESAVALAREVGYVNAGTVEFLVWHDPVAGGQRTAFLEMNTRLQVEHPVTECVTGYDLVRLQLAVAAGERVPHQQDIACSGHAFEARVYAEDPYAGFLPQAGRAELVRWPGGVRVDEGLESGQEVGTAYDPMLGKIVVHAPTREAARGALVRALDDTAVLGLTTNTGFLRTIAASREYRDAAIHTAWLDSDPAALGYTRTPETPEEAVDAAGRAWAATVVRHGDGPFAVADGWRSAGPSAPVRVDLRRDGEQFSVAVDPGDAQVPPGCVTLVRDNRVLVALRGQSWVFERPDPLRATDGSRAAEADVVSPMPGTVLSVDAVVGQRVRAGDVLGVVEAMKMELALRAPYDGTVSHVDAVAGTQVGLGHVLFTVEPAASAARENDHPGGGGR